MDKMRQEFKIWAEKEGFDTANTYDTARSKWVWLNPMTTDLWCAWKAARASQPAGDLQAAILALPLPDPAGDISYYRTSGFIGRVHGYTTAQMHDLLVAAASLAASARALEVQDKGEFEKLAKYQGGFDFTPAPSGCCENGWFPATYRDAMVELAWRVWTNKGFTPPVIAYSTDKESGNG